MDGSVPLVEYPLKVIWKGMWQAREANERRNASAKTSKLLLHHFQTTDGASRRLHLIYLRRVTCVNKIYKTDRHTGQRSAG